MLSGRIKFMLLCRYTYSSLIRVFGDEEGILKVMGHVNETKILSLPLLRIATER